MGKIQLLEAELAMERAAAKFRDAKAANDGKPAAEAAYRDAKAALNTARAEYRTLRGSGSAGANGDATVAPKAIAGKARK